MKAQSNRNEWMSRSTSQVTEVISVCVFLELNRMASFECLFPASPLGQGGEDEGEGFRSPLEPLAIKIKPSPSPPLLGKERRPTRPTFHPRDCPTDNSQYFRLILTD
jgi:hypothetical protein